MEKWLEGKINFMENGGIQGIFKGKFFEKLNYYLIFLNLTKSSVGSVVKRNNNSV